MTLPASRILLSTAAAAACIGLSAWPALAATDFKNLMSSPTGLCQAALPNYEGNIRKRPLALVNEGTSDAFITCSFPGFQGETHDTYYVYFRNRGSETITITCTAVYGSEVEGTPTFITKSLPRAPGVSGNLFWLASEGIATAYPLTLSCLLPPGGAIGNLHTGQFIDVGQ